MPLGARQFFVARKATPPTPYDYEVEYIETDGTASYINTGVVPSGDTQIFLQFALVSHPQESAAIAQSLCGARSSAASLSGRRWVLAINTITSVFRCFNPTPQEILPAIDFLRHSITISNAGIVFDETSYTTVGNSSTANPFCIGKDGVVDLATGQHTQFANVRFYAVSLTENGKTIFAGKPVVANGNAGMYDSVSGTVKLNAGSGGAITAGPRVRGVK